MRLFCLEFDIDIFTDLIKEVSLDEYVFAWKSAFISNSLLMIETRGRTRAASHTAPNEAALFVRPANPIMDYMQDFTACIRQ